MHQILKFLTRAAALLVSLNIHSNQQTFNAPDEHGERSIVVVIASYKNQAWYKQNLDSIFTQNYHNYKLIYIDDCSPDGTGDLVEHYVAEKGQTDRVTVIKNSTRVGALANYYTAIHMCKDNAIVVQVDGDDFLAHPTVLAKINDVYADPNIWFAYSQLLLWPANTIGWNQPYTKNNSLYGPRGGGPSHVRTFYAKLFKNIQREDLLYNGDFFSMAWDTAIILPMVEMAEEKHIAFIPEVLYIYNDINPINDHKIDRTLQKNLDAFIRNKTPYEPLEVLF
ncbi:MAG: glycosyltransferase [Candidatus Dependentiae bacterium]|nr:glycosyltransferase [Candidatus Dependentiae bacterium]